MKSPVLMLMVDGLPASDFPGSTAMPCYFGFRGIEASVFTGTDTTTHGVWTDYRRGPSSPYAWAPRIPGVVRLFRSMPTSAQHLVSTGIHQATRMARMNVSLPKSSMIPPDILGEMEFAAPQLPWEPGAYGGVTSLFDVLRAHGRSFTCIAPPAVSWWRTTDDKVLGALRRSVARGVQDFYYVKLVDFDRVSHHHGPDSPMAREEQRRTLARVDEMVELVADHADVPRWVVLSDHGFLPAGRHIGVAATLEEWRRRSGGFLYFLDSTMVRCWFGTDSARQRVTGFLDGVEGLVRLDEQTRRIHGLATLSDAYGDLVYVAEHGYVVWPDFFWKEPPRGMHGYLPHPELAPGLKAQGCDLKRGEEPPRLTDVMGILLHMLGIEDTC